MRGASPEAIEATASFRGCGVTRSRDGDALAVAARRARAAIGVVRAFLALVLDAHLQAARALAILRPLAPAGLVRAPHESCEQDDRAEPEHGSTSWKWRNHNTKAESAACAVDGPVAQAHPSVG